MIIDPLGVVFREPADQTASIAASNKHDFLERMIAVHVFEEKFNIFKCLIG